MHSGLGDTEPQELVPLNRMLSHLCSGIQPISEDRILMQHLLAVSKDAMLGLKSPIEISIAGPSGKTYRVVMADRDELHSIREVLRALGVSFREQDLQTATSGR